MSTKPILFNTDMVRATLEDRKTATRRAVKPPLDTKDDDLVIHSIGCGYISATLVPSGKRVDLKLPYRLGDTLYVRETFRIDYLANIPGTGRVQYKADGTYADFSFSPDRYDMMRRAQLKPGWRPSENMPREAARIFLRVTDVRVERLQDITPEQLRAEGIRLFLTPSECQRMFDRFGAVADFMGKRKEFSTLWNSTIAKPSDLALYGWDANPWVWVIEFERIGKEQLT